RLLGPPCGDLAGAALGERGLARRGRLVLETHPPAGALLRWLGTLGPLAGLAAASRFVVRHRFSPSARAPGRRQVRPAPRPVPGHRPAANADARSTPTTDGRAVDPEGST